MPHISSKKLEQATVQELDTLIASLVRDTGSQTRVNIFRELLTKTEKIMLAKRITIVFMLIQGASIYKIIHTLGISPSTAERYKNSYKQGKYKELSKWLLSLTKKGKRDKLITSLVSLAFTGRTKSFKQFVEEL